MTQKKSDADLEKLRIEQLYENGVNTSDRVIQICGEIERGDFDRLDSALSELERKNKSTITIRINSPGGDVYEALAMVGRIKSSRSHIVTEGYGQIMSAAVLLLASGDKRRMSKYSWFMHHESSFLIGGSTSEVKEEIIQMEREENAWCKWMAELSEKDADFWRTAANKKNFYLSSQECEECGIVDETF